MTDEWTNIKTKYPKNSQKVFVKLYDRKTDKYYEVMASFIDSEFYRGWDFKMPDGADIVHLPQWWKECQEKE